MDNMNQGEGQRCEHHHCCGGKGWKKWRHHGGKSAGCVLWAMGWLFTIGYLHLTFLTGVLALIIWPYYLGVHFAG
jgi:hypothetical protein